MSLPEGQAHDQFFAVVEELRRNSIDTMRRKSADYTGSSPDPFANFRNIEFLTAGRITVEDGLLVRMTDKMSRLGALSRGASPQVAESIDDTLEDLANYATIWRAYRRMSNPQA